MLLFLSHVFHSHQEQALVQNVDKSVEVSRALMKIVTVLPRKMKNKTGQLLRTCYFACFTKEEQSYELTPGSLFN